MDQILQIPFELRGKTNLLEVVYKANNSASESGFNSLLNLNFNLDYIIGYPTMHTYISKNECTGYDRMCGWIQLVKREYCSSEALDEPDEVKLSLDSGDPNVLYFAYGYPAEIYDAPCFNLNGNFKGKWTAYTYLVDVASRMNNNKISFLAGFQWGYEESFINNNLSVNMMDIKEIDIKVWLEHILFLKTQFPNDNFN